MRLKFKRYFTSEYNLYSLKRLFLYSLGFLYFGIQQFIKNNKVCEKVCASPVTVCIIFCPDPVSEDELMWRVSRDTSTYHEYIKLSTTKRRSADALGRGTKLLDMFDCKSRWYNYFKCWIMQHRSNIMCMSNKQGSRLVILCWLFRNV